MDGLRSRAMDRHSERRIRPSVRIRVARARDLEALLALEHSSFSGDRLSARSLRAHLGSPRAWLGVAVRGEALMGSALVFFRAGSACARLYSIAVARAARGMGVGLGLLRAAERAARARGARSLRLEVRCDNAAAIALYLREAYRPTGTRTRYYEDGADALRFEKALVRR